MVKTKQEKITPSPEFKAAVKAFQQSRKLKSWSQALLHLAAIGYEHETGSEAPEPFRDWGGWRENENSLKALMGYANRVTNYGANDPIHYVESVDDDESNTCDD